MNDDIELINSYGPYNHSIWDYKGHKFTAEEKLTGRVEDIVKIIKEYILSHFTLQEIEKLTIADVGCYDGWILEQLSVLPFKRLVGIEPRQRNITKGKMIRKHLGIKSRVEFICQSIETLDKHNEKYDIVLCNGLMLHLTNHLTAIHNLKSICKKLLFIETSVLSSKHITRSFKKDMKTKDIVYFFNKKKVGLSGHKFETSYYDGSTYQMSVVSFPTLESLIIYLEIEGLTDLTIIPFRKTPNTEIAIWINMKEYDSVEYENTIIDMYEIGQYITILDKKLVTSLYKYYTKGEKSFYTYLQLFKIKYFLSLYHNKYKREILKNIQFNPIEKISLEYAKLLMKEGDYRNAIMVLESITKKISADWRSVYRAFYLLYIMYKNIGERKTSERYKNLCYTCNPKYPLLC